MKTIVFDLLHEQRNKMYVRYSPWYNYAHIFVIDYSGSQVPRIRRCGNRESGM